MATRKYESLDYYLNLPWTYTVRTAIEDGEKFYIVCITEIPGLCTDSHTVGEAMENIKSVLAGVIELLMEDGEEIPIPVDENAYKGKISYRTSSRRHFMIAQEAQKLGVSLSQLLDNLVDRSIGR